MPGFCTGTAMTPSDCGSFLVSLRAVNLTGLVLSGIYERVVLNNNPYQVASVEQSQKQAVRDFTTSTVQNDRAFMCTPLDSKPSNPNSNNGNANANNGNSKKNNAPNWNCTAISGSGSSTASSSWTSNTSTVTQPLNNLLQDFDGVEPPSNIVSYDLGASVASARGWTRSANNLNRQTRFLIQKASVVSAIDVSALNFYSAALRLKSLCLEWNHDYDINSTSVEQTVLNAIKENVNLNAPLDPTAQNFPSYYSPVVDAILIDQSGSAPSALSIPSSVQFQFENPILWFILLIGLSQIWLVIETLLVLTVRAAKRPIMRLLGLETRLQVIEQEPKSPMASGVLSGLNSASNQFASVSSPKSSRSGAVRSLESVELQTHS